MTFRLNRDGRYFIYDSYSVPIYRFLYCTLSTCVSWIASVSWPTLVNLAYLSVLAYFSNLACLSVLAYFSNLAYLSVMAYFSIYLAYLRYFAYFIYEVLTPRTYPPLEGWLEECGYDAGEGRVYKL